MPISPLTPLLTLVAVAAAIATMPVASQAAADTSPRQVDHSGEQFTLDGQPATKQEASRPDGVCMATPDSSDTVACFTTRAKLGRAGAAALRAGKLPPGYTALPPGISREALIEQFEGMAQATGRPQPPGAEIARAATTHRSAGRRSKNSSPRARMAAGYSCRTDPYTYIWNSANYSGTSGTMGFTGQNWKNYSSIYDNKVSSFWAMNNATTRWHDYAYGQGAYYGNGFACRYVENLDNASMTDGGTANDRFSSWAIW